MNGVEEDARGQRLKQEASAWLARLRAGGRQDQEAFEDWYAADPDHANANNNLAVILRARGDWNEAIDCYRRALARNATDPFVHSNHGCLLLDIRMPYMGGFELQESMRAAGFRLPIIFLTAHGDIPMTVRAMKGGAYDFLEKPYNDQDLIDKVADALKVGLREYRQAQAHNQTQDLLKQLSAREREVFDLLIEGKASKVIAAELNISYKTVEVHRAHIREKLGATSLAELVRLGMRGTTQHEE